MDQVPGPQSSSLIPHLSQYGFTLIELMISMALALVLLMGITAIFVSSARVASTVAVRSSRMGDVYLATGIMQKELRASRALTAPPFPADLAIRGVSLPGNYPSSFPSLPYWDTASKTLTYQDTDGNTGIFQYQRTSNDRIYWLRADASETNFQELIRDLDTANGMTAASASGVWTVTLNAAYSNENKQTRTMSLSFKAWARN